MYEFNLVQISNVFITDDGTDSGDRAISDVRNLHLLYSDFNGKTERNADGSMVIQTADLTDVEIDIEFNWMYKTKLDAVKTVLAQFKADGLAFDVEIEGTMGTFACTGKFRPPGIEFGTTTIGGKVNSAKILLAVTPD